MSKRKTLLSALFVMFLWGSLFPMVKLGYSAYGIDTTGDILLFAGIRFTVCGIVIYLYVMFKDKSSYKSIKKSILPETIPNFV